jgi:hypothetical protein
VGSLAPIAPAVVASTAPSDAERAARAEVIVAGFHRRLKTTLVAFGVSLGGAIGLETMREDVFAVAFVGGAMVGVVSALRLFRQWFRLRDVGIGVRDALGERWRDRIAAGEGGRAPASALAASAPATSAPAVPRGLAHLAGPARVSAARALVQSWKRRLAWAAGSAAISLASLIAGVSANEEVFIAPMLIGAGLAVVHGALLARRSLQLRRLGIGVRDAYGDAWEAKVERLDTRPRATRLQDEVAAVAPADVLATTAGRTLAEAVDDRFTIRETWEALDDTDRRLVPDVMPTANTLFERIVALATSLARLEGAVAPDALPALDARIAAARQAASVTDGAPSAETKRRLALLERQRASMAELAERQSTMQDRLERASLALRSLRLDVVKLRALGVGATMSDVTMATQEARAISVDIDRALDVADELRRL